MRHLDCSSFDNLSTKSGPSLNLHRVREYMESPITMLSACLVKLFITYSFLNFQRNNSTSASDTHLQPPPSSPSPTKRVSSSSSHRLMGLAMLISATEDDTRTFFEREVHPSSGWTICFASALIHRIEEVARN